MEDRKVLLSVKDLIVKFHVRGRVLTAIRGVSLDIYENESIAIVGESGSGKSVFTKTFAGMLDSNGFIDNGKIIFSDEELSDTVVKLNDNAKKVIAENKKKLDEYSRLEFGADTYKAILELESEKRRRADLSKEETAAYEKKLHELKLEKTNAYNLKQTFDPSKEKDKIKEAGKKISELDTKIRAFEKEHEQKVKSVQTVWHMIPHTIRNLTRRWQGSRKNMRRKSVQQSQQRQKREMRSLPKRYIFLSDVLVSVSV